MLALFRRGQASQIWYGKEKQVSKDSKKTLKKNLDNPVIKKKVQNKKVTPISNKKSKEITKTSDDKPTKKT